MSKQPRGRPQRPRCAYPGCTRPARQPEARGAPPKYCYIDGHKPERAHRARERLRAEASRLDAASDPNLLLAEITSLHRANRGLQADLDTALHHHQTHHPNCPGPGRPAQGPNPDTGEL